MVEMIALKVDGTGQGLVLLFFDEFGLVGCGY
jgi:hypothetical protein